MPPQPVTPKKMPFEKYQPFVPLVLPDRTWPNRTITKAPLWCSVDLRDGNQALIDPMDPERKRRMFDDAREDGLQGDRGRLPVGQPARLRLRAPADRGGPDPRRRHHPGADAVPPGPDRAHLRVPAGRAPGDRPLLQLDSIRCSAGWCSGWTKPASPRSRSTRPSCAASSRRRSRAPTSATSTRPRASRCTELEFAIEICDAVMDVIEPTPEHPIILNLPATVEMYTPNVYADVIEWFRRTIRSATRSSCRCTPTTTAAARWPRPSSA